MHDEYMWHLEWPGHPGKFNQGTAPTLISAMAAAELAVEEWWVHSKAFGRHPEIVIRYQTKG